MSNCCTIKPQNKLIGNRRNKKIKIRNTKNTLIPLDSSNDIKVKEQDTPMRPSIELRNE